MRFAAREDWRRGKWLREASPSVRSGVGIGTRQPASLAMVRPIGHNDGSEIRGKAHRPSGRTAAVRIDRRLEVVRS